VLAGGAGLDGADDVAGLELLPEPLPLLGTATTIFVAGQSRRYSTAVRTP